MTNTAQPIDPIDDESIPPASALALLADARVDLTPKAVEMAKQAIARRESPTQGLRLGVRGGGCSGASYVVEFADKIRPRDRVFEFDGLKVVVDPKSLVYLRGAVLDYEMKLMHHGFKFENPNESKSCRCGDSFSI